MKLSDQVEAATGPDRELDRAIIDAISTDYNFGTRSSGLTYGKAWDQCPYEEWTVDGGVVGHAPDYTASIDAAMTLVPEGWQMIDGQDVPERSFRRLTLNKGGFSPYFQGLAATPALALCAAALRARGL